MTLARPVAVFMQCDFTKFIVSLSEREHLFPLVQKIRGKKRGAFCGPEMDLCIEGFESSANTYVFNYIRRLQEGLAISHHTHAVANLKRAIRYDVPTLVLFRNPDEAIPSLVARFRPKLREAMTRYTRFYQYVHRVEAHFVLASFDEVTTDIASTVERMERQFRISFGSYDPEEIETRTIEHIRKWTHEHGNPAATPLPDGERERQKERIRRDLVKHPGYGSVRAVYETTKALYDESVS
jgi:hypothetical protein